MKRGTCVDLCTSKLGHSSDVFHWYMFVSDLLGEKRCFQTKKVMIYIVSDNQLNSQHPCSFPTLPNHTDGRIQRPLSNTPIRKYIQRFFFHGASKSVMSAHQWPKFFRLVFKGTIPQLTLACLSSCVFHYTHTHKLPLKPGEIPHPHPYPSTSTSEFWTVLVSLPWTPSLPSQFHPMLM